MAEDDIYRNKAKYERYLETLDRLIEQPAPSHRHGARRYWCRNPTNLDHFRTLHRQFEAQDMSYQARLRFFQILLFLTWLTDKNLADCDRDDVTAMVAAGQNVNRTIESKSTFLRHLKRIWKRLFPEFDESGRIVDELVPYPVRHVSTRIERSKQKRRNDRLTEEEIKKLFAYFGTDVQMQAYIALSIESLGRPQEICFRRIRDIELCRGGAKIWVSDHSKTGVRFLTSIWSWVYVSRWLAVHPHGNNEDAFLFVTNKDSRRQLRPENVNKKLRTACRKIGINRCISGYSLKRTGVSRRRLLGDSDVEIQRTAGWTTAARISTYDLTNEEDVFQMQIEKHGPGEREPKEAPPTAASCRCGSVIAIFEDRCRVCGNLRSNPKVEAEDGFRDSSDRPDADVDLYAGGGSRGHLGNEKL